MNCEKVEDHPTNISKHKDPKIMNCIFIGHACNSSAYWFLLNKLSIEDIYPNTIMKSKNTILFKDVFSLKEIRENHSLKRTIKGSSDHYQSDDDEVELIMSKREKITKIFGPIFSTYLLVNEPWTYFKIMSCSEASNWKKTINNKIKPIMNNHTWELVNLPFESRPLGHKWILKRKIKVDDTNINIDLLLRV